MAAFDLILDGGRTPGGIASTVVDCTKSELSVLRPGPLTLEQLKAALRLSAATVHGYCHEPLSELGRAILMTA